MRPKFLLTAIAMLIIHTAFCDTVQTSTAKVNKAIVYLSGAELTCTSDFAAQQGINQFVFEGVSPNVDPNSLQASAKGNIVIMDVKFDIKYNEKAKKPPVKSVTKELKLATDSLTMLNFDIDELNDRLQGLQTEKNILLNNRMIKGDLHRDTLELLKGSIEFLRARLTNITSEVTIIKKKLYIQNEIRQSLESRIAQLNEVDQQGEEPEQVAVYTITVMAHADAGTPSVVSVSFFVPNAAWLPTYDLRANANGTIDLVHKAELRQTTGMDWNNVDLTLSTGNPSQSTAKPTVTPFYLSFIQQFREKKQLEMRKDMDAAKPSAYSTGREGYSENEEALQKAMSLDDFTIANEGMIQTEYDIKIKYSIPTDDQMHVVAIQSKAIKADYKYSVVPKLDVGVYLIAELSDWNDMNLIPGTARVYFDGSYIGRTYLNPDASVDTLELSLGKDRSIAVSRKKVKDKTKERILADDKIISTTYEITVRNPKASAINIEVTDQVPVSRDPSIKVEPLAHDGAEYNEETGELTWKMNIKSKENKKMQFTYEVKIPRDKRLAGL